MSKPKGHFVSEAIPVPAFPGDDAVVPGEPVWTTYRTLDPVRAHALQVAVTFGVYIPADDTPEAAVRGLINVSRMLEQYLVGEEADGQD